MMIESLAVLKERLETITTPRDTREHLPAATLGVSLYRQLNTDYETDAVLFRECVAKQGWQLEDVGQTGNPMFVLLLTDKGMVTLTQMPGGDDNPLLRQWLGRSALQRSPLHRIVEWFKHVLR